MAKETVVGGAKACKLCGQRFTNDAAFCPFDGEPLEQVQGGWDSASDPLIGALIDGRYEVMEALGEGGMGTVYRVRHHALQRQFAMKVLRPDLAREPELCSRFIQEARTAATIAHPNVVQITDYGSVPSGSPYFVMELLDGAPLSRLVKQAGPIPAARAVRILVQIAAGIGAAHRAGVVHRDLKPDNVFIVPDTHGNDQVKILDFGVAKVAGAARMTRTGMVFGSPHYMSPEQASGQPVDHRADIYALGVVMYELFTGHVPFEADTFMGVLTKHMFMAPEPFVQKAENMRELGALEDITLRCLEKKPENRYPTVEALVADVEEVVRLGAGDDIEVRPSSAGSAGRSSEPAFRLADELELPDVYEVSAARARRGQHDSRYRIALGALVAAVLMLAGAIVALLWLRSKAAVPPAPPASALVDSSGSLAPAAPVAHPSPVVVTATISDAEPAAPPVTTPPQTAHPSQSASTTPRSRTPHPVKTSPPATTTAPPAATSPRSPAGTGEIVNPWAK